MTWKRQAVIIGGIVLAVVFALGLWVRGPEPTLDWILERLDLLLRWIK